MRWVSVVFVIVVLAVPLGILAFAIACTDTKPSIQTEAVLSTANVERAQELMREHDPRKLKSGETKTVRMNEEELNLVLNHLIRRIGGGGAALSISDGSLALLATADLSALIPHRYLNIDASVRESDGVPRVEHLKLGGFAIPPALVDTLIAFGAEHLYRASGVHDAADVIHAVELSPRQLAVTYEWKAGIVDAVRDRIVSRQDRERMKHYTTTLADAVEEQAGEVTFVSLLGALLSSAGERAADSDPVTENRAALIVMAAYVNGKSLQALAPEANDWVQPRRIRLKLGGRRDFARHFSTSAALVVAGGSELANAVGLFKEIDDAGGGSGFSFRDLAADMAGTRFGNIAVTDAASARELQRRAAAGFTDAAVMPSVDGLEEQLSDEQFTASYGGVGGERYAAVVREIERRISGVALYRP